MKNKKMKMLHMEQKVKKEKNSKNKMEKDFNKEIKNDLRFKFWNKYCEADLIDRQKILKPVVKRVQELSNIKGLSKEQNDVIWTTTLMGYFDDLIEYKYVEELFQKQNGGKTIHK